MKRSLLKGIHASSGRLRKDERWNKKIKRIVSWAVWLMMTGLPCLAAEYHVAKSGNDANPGGAAAPWLTIQRAANAATAGDTVRVHSGTYNERVTIVNPGAAGRPVTFAAAGRVSMQGFIIGHNRSDIRIVGFEITGLTAANTAAIYLDHADRCELLDNYIHHLNTTVAGISLHALHPSSRVVMRGNRIGYCGGTRGEMPAISVYGNNNLVEYNDISHNDDYTRAFGQRNIIRNNYFHDSYRVDFPDHPLPEGPHIDGVQNYTSTYDNTVTRWLLVDANYNADTPGTDAHFLITQDASNMGSADIIMRRNVLVNIGEAILLDDQNVDNVRLAHNTAFHTGAARNQRWQQILFTHNSVGGKLVNNLFYDTGPDTNETLYAVDDSSRPGFFADYNLFWQSGTRPAEPHVIWNQDPLLADPAARDLHLQSGSPARASAGPLATVVSAAGNGSTFSVTEAGYFIDGWEIAEGDLIQVGANAPVRITGVDYAANTITVATPIAWNTGDWVNLAFPGAAGLDRGAYPYRADGQYDYQIALTHPDDQAVVGGTVAVTAGLVNADLMRKVIFYIDGVPQAEVDQAPFTFRWDTRPCDPNSFHTVEARAYAFYAGPVLWKADTVTVQVANQGIFLTSPAGGETWIQNTSHAINWSSSGVTETVRIELFRGGVPDSVIAENQAVADGSYAWSIPADQATGNDYSIKLTAGTHESPSGNFSIAVAGAPVVTTNPATDVTQTTAVLRGAVHPMGYQTTYRFEYGLTTAYGSTTSVAILNAGADTTAVQAALAGLTAGTVYHFRLVAENSAGAREGFDRTFTTSSGGGGGGSSSDAGGGGGGGGGCFMTASRKGVPAIAEWVLFFLALFCLRPWKWKKRRQHETAP